MTGTVERRRRIGSLGVNVPVSNDVAQVESGISAGFAGEFGLIDRRTPRLPE